MQSIFRLPWCGEHLSPKMADKASLDALRPAPVVDMPVFRNFKRKRSGSPDPLSLASLPPVKKQRPDPPAAAAHVRRPAIEVAPAKSDGQQTLASLLPAQASAHTAISTTTSLNALAAPTGIVPAPQPPREKILSTTQSDGSSMPASTLHSPSGPTDGAPDATTMAACSDSTNITTRVQEVIDNQFNMQILLKHNELRLIEQELAKCQVALEQLRRCELRPFPGSNQPSEIVTSGSGPALAPQPGFTRPNHPAPYGVTDGPYTRHYAQWLVQDPQFDSMSELALAYLENSVSAAGRPTRNSGSARKSTSQSVSYPARSTEALQSIPNYPTGHAKDKSAPLILKRSTDGQLVKLVCNNCHRGNFSSIQGFLNHCRIAHKVDLKSHDEAAIKCGQPMDESEMASLPPTTVNTPVAKPTSTRASTSAVSTPCRSTVHPLNGVGVAPIFHASSRQPSGLAPTPVLSLASVASSTSSEPLKPDGHLPRLSAYFAKHQLGGDLAKAAALAKQKVDLTIDDELLSPDTTDHDSPLHASPGSYFLPGTSRVGPAGADATTTAAADALARPPSRKGFRPATFQRPRPSPLAPTTAAAAADIDSPQDNRSLNLSPHTVDSNPGLVSDHDDEEEDEDDQGSASEAESPRAVAEMRHPASDPRSCADNMDLVVVEECHDLDRRTGVVIRRNSLHGDDVRALHSAAARPAGRKFAGGK